MKTIFSYSDIRHYFCFESLKFPCPFKILKMLSAFFNYLFFYIFLEYQMFIPVPAVMII